MRFNSIKDLREKCGNAAADRVEWLWNKTLTPGLDEFELNTARVALNEAVVRKYRNEPCTGINGEKFDSKQERRDYERLIAQHGRRNVMRQVSIRLTEKQRMVVDFLILLEVREDGTFVGRFADSKGIMTRVWKNKADVLRDKHGLSVELLTK